MTNTENDSPDGQEPSFDSLTGDSATNVPSQKDEALTALEDRLTAAKDARQEERFVWILVCVILVDVLWFRNAPNPTFPIVILILEAVVLFILANRMGVDEARGLFERLIQSLTHGGRE